MIVKSFTPLLFPSILYLFTQGKPYWRGRISTVDLHVLSSLDQLLFILKILFTFLQNNPPQWGRQPYWAFPFSKSSLVYKFKAVRYRLLLELRSVPLSNAIAFEIFLPFQTFNACDCNNMYYTIACINATLSIKKFYDRNFQIWPVAKC